MFKHSIKVLVAASYLVGPIAAFTGTATALSDSRLLSVPLTGRIAGEVNGNRATFAILPDAPSVPILNPDLVQRTGISGGIFGADARVGPTKIKGSTGVQHFSVASFSFKRRAIWFGRAFEPDTDVILGPGSFPADPIRWVLKKQRSVDTREYKLPLVSLGAEGFGTEFNLNNEKVVVQFSLTQNTTLATAAAGRLIAEVQGGKLVDEPTSGIIRLGIARPLRRMNLTHSLKLGPLAISSLLVRALDYGSVADVADENADPSEIVVLGRLGKIKPIKKITVGQDFLGRCSDLTMDGNAHTLTLAC